MVLRQPANLLAKPFRARVPVARAPPWALSSRGKSIPATGDHCWPSAECQAYTVASSETRRTNFGAAALAVKGTLKATSEPPSACREVKISLSCASHPRKTRGALFAGSCATTMPPAPDRRSDSTSSPTFRKLWKKASPSPGTVWEGVKINPCSPPLVKMPGRLPCSVVSHDSAARIAQGREREPSKKKRPGDFLGMVRLS